MITWRPYGPIDGRIDEAAKYYLASGDRFGIDEALYLVLNGIPGTSVRGVRNIFAQINRVAPDWQIDHILIDYTKQRLRQCLRQQEGRMFGTKVVYVRRFANYPDENGHRWYQTLRTMTIDELLASVRSRHRQKDILEMHIDVLEHLIAEARRHKARTVGEVLDEALPLARAAAAG